MMAEIRPHRWLYLVLSSWISAAQARATETCKPEDWYTRYSAYPPYCSTPREMEKRRIPPLTRDSRTGETRIRQVTVLIRHGARTPYTSPLNCWVNYSADPETGVWNCNLAALSAPPSPNRISEEEQRDAGRGSQAMLLFEKRYDAMLDNPSSSLSNYLNGTCQLGQLLLQGYEQEIKNGEHLRAAYVYHGDGDGSHERTMGLIDTSGGQLPWDRKNLFYRVDEGQRTLMSGQVLLRGMLQPEIKDYFEKNKVYPVVPLHMVDGWRDILEPNEDLCPRLEEIRERFTDSSTFRAFNESEEANTLRAFQRNVLKIEGEMDATDCLMTTICTDRPLPAPVDDYQGDDDEAGHDRKNGRRLYDADGDNADETLTEASYGTNLFQRLYKFEEQQYAMLYMDNDAEYAKLAMGPLWAEIVPNMKAIIHNQADTCCPPRPPAKLTLISGHDTTLMPMLATLGPRVFDGKWASFASMVILEIHEINVDGKKDDKVFKTNHAFRLLYNGKVLTHLVDGCPTGADLCDFKVFLDRVESFATGERNCTRQDSAPDENFNMMSRFREVQSIPGALAALYFLAIASAAFGSLVTCFTTNFLTKYRKRRRIYVLDMDEEEIQGISMEYA